jgi:DNA-directed RNA polymerase specialized sigma24 family protein
MITHEEIERYYRKNGKYITLHFAKAGANGKSQELAHDIFIALLESADKIDDIHRYAWGIIRNKVKMLYRSADHKAEKIPYIDGLHESTIPDICSICDMIDNSRVAEY